mmetsp:Transcript_13661/g.29008  ORF Transcript_13661/g.29008 Transcript_13661/m.29008 type:complete len:393 (+) Transcript_13661:181-1359(+)
MITTKVYSKPTNHRPHTPSKPFLFGTLILLFSVITMTINSHNFMMKSIEHSTKLMAAKATIREAYHEELWSISEEGTKRISKRNIEDEEFLKRDCFRARNTTVPRDMYGKLPRPYINLGFPKMGTTSLHGFFGCGGYRSVHYRCNVTTSCGDCLKEQASRYYNAHGDDHSNTNDDIRNINRDNPPPLTLRTCGHSDMYAQIDNGMYFPQIELLPDLLNSLPNATFFITFRSMHMWWKSLKAWPPSEPIRKMNNILRNINITGLPEGKGRDLREMSEWFCWHVERVRDLLDNSGGNGDRNQYLVEVDIEEEGVGRYMQDLFRIHKNCWGHANANVLLHPELKGNGTAELEMPKGGGAHGVGDLPWLIRGKIIKGGGLVMDENNATNIVVGNKK